MGIYFRNQEGRSGMLDVSMYLRARGALPFKVQDGNVFFKTPEGGTGAFNVAEWALENGYDITQINGFNNAISALDVPPEGMNSLDQAVFYMDGQNLDALRGLFGDAKKLSDGRVVVLDHDGLWKTMWSHKWTPPEGPPDYDDLVNQGRAVDLKQGVRVAGIAFVMSLAGVEPAPGKNGEIKPEDIGKMLKIFRINLPVEGRIMVGRLVEQTTGIEKWKFEAALINPGEVGDWLKSIKSDSSFTVRQRQAHLTELLVETMHEVAAHDFVRYMKTLEKSEFTKRFICNLKETADQFIHVLVSMDVIPDMSRITGLDEWKTMAANNVRKEKLPPMPSFVPKLVQLLHWVLPIVSQPELAIAKGLRGLKSVTNLLTMIDDTIYSLKDVPDSTAKSKMLMVLKTFQTRLESKMAHYYHPMDDKSGTKTNEFMDIKAMYAEKREMIYQLVQMPKETWVQHLMSTFRDQANIEAYYDVMPDNLSNLIQSLIGLELAYDMQPWVDTNYQKRLHDPFAMMTEEFGSPPPESGYLSKNSPRSALNIIETLVAGAGMMLSLPDTQRKQVLRSPALLAKVLKNMQTASVSRETSSVETMSKVGLFQMDDPYGSPDPERIWEDPELVQQDIDEQMMQQMQEMEEERQVEAMKQIEQSPESFRSPGGPQEGGPEAQPPQGQEAMIPA